jgi:hypothetical protein
MRRLLVLVATRYKTTEDMDISIEARSFNPDGTVKTWAVVTRFGDHLNKYTLTWEYEGLASSRGDVEAYRFDTLSEAEKALKVVLAAEKFQMSRRQDGVSVVERKP